MMKHISDIKKMERCEKLLWNTKKYPQPFSIFVTYNENINLLGMKKLKKEVFFEGKRNDSNDAFFQCVGKFDAFMNVRFEFLELRIKINIMVKNTKGFDVYFTYPSCFPKESEAQSMADTMWVLHNLKVKVQNIYCIHLNHEYIRGNQLNVEKLLVISKYLYNDKNKRGNSIEVLVRRRFRNLRPILVNIDKTLEMDKIEKPRSSICTRKNKCSYFDSCFPQDDDLSVYHLVSSSKKFELIENGVLTMDNIDFDSIEGSKHQFAQYMAAVKKELFFDTAAVDAYFRNIKYPLSYLDFEWETYAFPPYKGMKPYDVLTFQYSLHIEHESGKLDHLDFLGKGDCRIEFIDRLIQDIPKEGSIMCFNVEGAEKLRLKQMAVQYPQYTEELTAIWDRMIDLAIPFSSGVIYDTRMAGMYSLKKLVSIFSNYSYDDLKITHGIEAVQSYASLDGSENKEIIDSLLKYCAMDTYAMYLIYHWIIDVKNSKLNI